MVAVPADEPAVTTPLASTLATDGLLLLQVPPEVASLNELVPPAHTLSVPVIAAGAELIVSVWEVRQPVPNVYTITVVPGVTPVAIPVEASIVATPVFVLVHVPPLVASVNVEVNATQSVLTPDIEAGSGFTVTVSVV